jgi:glutamine synthetase
MKPDLSTLRPVPWLEGTAMVLCDLIDHHTHEPVPHSPRADAQDAGCARQRHGLHADDGNRTGVLPVRESFDEMRKAASATWSRSPATTRITTSSRPPRKNT